VTQPTNQWKNCITVRGFGELSIKLIMLQQSS